MRRTRPRTPLIACALLVVASSPARADDHADSPGQGTVLVAGAAPTPGALDPGDQDWFRVRATAGTRFVVQTSQLGGGADTLLAVWGPSGAFLASDDDSGGGYASKVELTASATGTHWVRVTHYDRTNGRGTYAIAASTPGSAPAPVTPAPTPTTVMPANGAIAAAPAFDPKLAGASLAVRTRLAGSSPYGATLAVVDGAGAVVRTLATAAQRQPGVDHTDAWDGRDAGGAFVRPGRYTLRLDATRGGQTERHERAVEVVRVGIVSIDFQDEGPGGARVPLEYHRTSPTTAGTRFALDAAGPAWAIERSPLGDLALDRADGTPLALPATWTRLESPPRTTAGGVALRGRGLPVAYRAGARPTLEVRLGDRAAHGGAAVACNYPLAGAPLRLVLDGEASTELAPGAAVTVRAAAVPAAVGRYDQELAFRFEMWDGQGWAALPGALRALQRVYVVVDRPPPTSSIQRPWVAVLDKVAQWSAGRAADAAGVMEVVTRGVNEAEGLRYDTVMGAPAYSGGGSISSPELDLDAWLARDNGSVVNCLDCASTVTALAAQLGVDARVAELGYNFELHWIRGIGGSQFIHDLFGGWHAFSFHAVATVDGAATIHDACLRVDDDDRPDASPFRERLPVGMPFNRYREKLSPTPFGVNAVGVTLVR